MLLGVLTFVVIAAGVGLLVARAEGLPARARLVAHP